MPEIDFRSAPIREYFEELLGGDWSGFVCAPDAPSAIRINPLKADPSRVDALLSRLGVSWSPHPLCPEGRILAEDTIPLSHTLAFFRGWFCYQGVSSQMPVLALDPRPGESVLDLCASPGSKTTQIAARMRNRGRLTANDLSRFRQQSLVTNLKRAGVQNVCILCLPGQRIGKRFPERFDRVLVDAPCSALNRRSSVRFPGGGMEARLKSLSNVQRMLLVSAVKALRPGGVLVYSTCSLSAEENEGVVDSVLGDYPVEVESTGLPSHPSLREGLPGFRGRRFHPSLCRAVRVLPVPNGFEGFFIARLRKTGGLERLSTLPAPAREALLAADAPEMAPLIRMLEEKWGIDPAVFREKRFLVRGKKVWMAESGLETVPAEGLVGAGMTFLSRKKTDWKITHEGVQVLSGAIRKRRIELNPEEMKRLFRDGRLPAPGVERGYYALSHSGIPVAGGTAMEGEIRVRLPHRFSLVL